MHSREPVILLAFLAAVYAISAWQPSDMATWWMEAGPMFVVLPFFLWIHSRIGLTSLTLRVLAFEGVLVAVGAHYTYAHVPLGFWVSDLVGWERNHYDRFGHFMQGVFPALLFRELLLRTSPIRRGKWLFVITTAICLAISASYELVEWAGAIVFGDGATEFLGTQGDPWDSQWDMFLALVGSILTQLLLGKKLDRLMREMDETHESKKGSDPVF